VFFCLLALALANNQRPVVQVGRNPISLNFMHDQLVTFELVTTGVPPQEFSNIELVFESPSTCFMQLYKTNSPYPLIYMSFPGVVAFNSWNFDPLVNGTNSFYANSTLGSCLNTMVSAMLPSVYQLQRKNGAALNGVRVLANGFFNVSVGSAGQMVQPFAVNVTTNATFDFFMEGPRFATIGPGLPPAYFDSNQLGFSSYGGSGAPLPGPVNVRIFVSENRTNDPFTSEWVYINISIVEENVITLKAGAPAVKVSLPYGISNIFSVPLKSKANTVVQLSLVSGSCPSLSYNANNQEIIGTGILTTANPQFSITLPPGSGSWPLVVLSNIQPSCVYGISVLA